MKALLCALALALPIHAVAEETFVGVGMTLTQTEAGKIFVESLVAGAPAERSAAIMAGDEIISVQSTRDSKLVPVERMDLGEVVGMIRGEEGTPVRLHMGRGDGQYEVTLIRAVITVP